MSRPSSFRGKLPPGHVPVPRAQEGALPATLRTALGRLRGMGLDMQALRKPAGGFSMFFDWPERPEDDQMDRMRELMEAAFSSAQVWMRAHQPPALSIVASGEPGTWLVFPLDPISPFLDTPLPMGQVRLSEPREVALIDWAALAQGLRADDGLHQEIMGRGDMKAMAYVDLPSGVMMFTGEAARDPVMAAIARASQPLHPFIALEVVALAGELARTLDNGYRLLATGDLLAPDGTFIASHDTAAIASMVAAISGNPDWARDNLGQRQHEAVLAWFQQVMHMSALIRKENARVPGFAEAVLAFCQQDDLDEDEFFASHHREAFAFMMECLDEDGLELDDLREAITLAFTLQRHDPEDDAPEA